MYDVVEQRLAALATLHTKRAELYRQGVKSISSDDSLSFDVYCYSVKSMSDTEEFLQWLSAPDLCLFRLARRIVKLDQLVARLESGEDPRRVLMDVVSNV